jgi:hypothetical protein
VSGLEIKFGAAGASRDFGRRGEEGAHVVIDAGDLVKRSEAKRALTPQNYTLTDDLTPRHLARLQRQQ